VPAPAPSPAPAPAPIVDPILAQIENLTKVIQANALLNTNMPQNQQSTEDILAAIINPVIPDKK
jgi:hypothetical protein